MNYKQILSSSIFGIALSISGAGEAVSESLEDALVLTYATNPQLEQARAVLRQTDENVSIAFGGWLPQINLAAAVNRQEQRLQGQKTGAPVETATATLTVNQNIFRGGRTIFEVKKAKQQVAQQRAALKNTEQGVLLAAIQAYLEVYQNEKILSLRLESEGNLNVQLKAARDRFEVGEITRTDVAQAESRLAQAQANTALARAFFKDSACELFPTGGAISRGFGTTNHYANHTCDIKSSIGNSQAK